ncbi:MAG: DUF91 domain-containing protein [Oscillospiraceae bacterium]|nr:DUF91 domain-containing protein [Oscillospiraceae bacterium]
MPISHTVWSLDEKKPLQVASLIDEKELELLLRDNIEILNKGWLVISNQVKTDAGKFIDILCIDHDGDMVVVELKKDLTPREVTAQVIDYAASVSKMTAEEIAQLYLSFTNGNETLNAAFQKKFGTALDEGSVNQRVKMVIVAAKMDDGTERIIRFLRETYSVDINILFFRVFQCSNERLISRTWFEEDIEEYAPAEVKQKGPWNGEYYASFGEGSRNWEDARKYGFISAGGGSWYSKTLSLLSPGDRVWVNIPHTGYVGVGIVTEPAQQAKDAIFEHKGEKVKMADLSLRGDYLYSADDPENAEYVVKVQWIKTVHTSEAVKELGFFGNQNSVCRPQAERWNFTVDRLKKCWGIE